MSPEQLAEAIREMTELRDELKRDADWHTDRKQYDAGSSRRRRADGLNDALIILARHQEQASTH